MSASLRPVLVALAFATLAPTLRAQQSRLQDVVPARPITKPSRRELDRLEALKLYGLAADRENKNQLPQALKTYEKALRFDPDSTAIRRALIPLYIAVDRQPDALDCCRKTLDLDPGDFDAWYLYGRELRSLDREPEARTALEKALACKALEEKPEVRLAIAYDLGALCEKAKLYDKAETAFRDVVRLLENPAGAIEEGPLSAEELSRQAAETYERIGRLCLSAGKPDRAVAAFKSAQARDPGRAARLSLNLAEVLTAQRKPAEALRYVNHYLGQQPPATDGYELKIKLLRALDRGNDVIPELEKHAAIDKFNNALKLLLAREYRRGGKPALAERLYEGLLSAAPEVETYRGLFAVFKDEGEAGAAKLLQRLNRAIEVASPADEKKIAPDDTQAAHARAMLAVLREDAALVKALLPVAHERIVKGPPLNNRLRVLLAALAERTHQLDVAEELYRSCLDREGRVLLPGVRRQAEHEVYGGLLRILALGRKHAAIVELCKQGLAHAEATNRVLFHLELAHAQMARDKIKEALEAIDAAVETAVDTVTAKPRLICRANRVQMLAQAERYDAAEAEGKALLKEYTDEADVRTIRFALSAVYSMARQHAKAEEQLLAVLKSDPANARANNDLGYGWADQNKNLEEAERMIRKALELDQQQRRSGDALGLDGDRDNAAYIDSLGWVLFRRGRLKEAREQLEKAARLPDGADDPVVWDHLGDVCFRLKDDRRAGEVWRQALKLYDSGHRRKGDGRAKDIAEKLKRLETAGQPRRD